MQYKHPIRTCVPVLMIVFFYSFISLQNLEAASLSFGDILVTDTGTDCVFKVDPLTGSQELISQGGDLDNPLGLTIDSDGQIIVATRGSAGSGKLVKVDPLTGGQSVIITSDSMFESVIDTNGDYIVTVNSSAHGAYGVKRITPSGTESWISRYDLIENPRGICVGPDNHILIADPRYNSVNIMDDILHIDRFDGTQTVVSNNNLFGDPWDLALEDSNHILVLDQTRYALMRVALDDGSQSILSSDGLLQYPESMAIDYDGTVVVSDRYSGIFRIDPDDGSQSLMSTGGYLSFPQGIHIVVPEPASAGMMLILAASPLLLRKRRSDI